MVQDEEEARERLARWFDDARQLRRLARRIGLPKACAGIMEAFRRDIEEGPDRHLVERIELQNQESIQENLYVFPDRRAIYEIRIPALTLGGYHHFIAFAEDYHGQDIKSLVASLPPR